MNPQLIFGCIIILTVLYKWNKYLKMLMDTIILGYVKKYIKEINNNINNIS
jgi:hypothetical protein